MERTTLHPPVLVVDDQLVQRTILSAILREEGYRVQTAEHGGPALAIMRTSPERMLVTLDLIMPYVSGIEVLGAVAADKRLEYRHALILVTAAVTLATHGRVKKLRERLGISLVVKPFTVEQLLEAMVEAEQRLTGVGN